MYSASIAGKLFTPVRPQDKPRIEWINADLNRRRHGLRTFGSTLMLFLFICGIRFIRVICGSWTTVLFTAENACLR
jgi:hypothetical protein